MKINGVLLLNKDSGHSSNKELQLVKKLFKADKAGHTGTLDPFACGLLPICLGEATKFSSFLLECNKEYYATIKLGEITTTYDLDGEIIETNPVNCNADQIIKVIDSFIGTIDQIPPIYSALKLNGKPLYKYARNGISVELKPRKIHIYSIKFINYEDNLLTISVLCSKGTYIRSLAYDIGMKLGCGAYLHALNRTKIGSFHLENSVKLSYISSFVDDLLYAHLLPIDKLVSHFPAIDLLHSDLIDIKNGKPIYMSINSNEDSVMRLYYKLSFIGLGVIKNNQIKVKRLLNTQNIEI